VFYDALDSKDKYESEQNEQAAFTAHGIPFRMYIAKFNGGRYIADDVKEAHLKSCVFFVRNEDDNCLYAALFAALAYRDRKVVIDNTEHTFDKHDFERDRSMSNYNVQSKTRNLRYFTLKLKELLDQDDNATDDQVIAAFEATYNVSVCVVHEDAFSFEAVTSASQLCLLRQMQPYPHYNVLTNFVTYARLVNQKYTQYNYCYEHHDWYDRKRNKQCEKCVTNQKFCCYCRMFHEIADVDSTPSFKCATCDKLLHTKGCCDGHIKICR
jgi:hypothetical protein